MISLTRQANLDAFAVTIADCLAAVFKPVKFAIVEIRWSIKSSYFTCFSFLWNFLACSMAVESHLADVLKTA